MQEIVHVPQTRLDMGQNPSTIMEGLHSDKNVLEQHLDHVHL
jgi:hypothetical protein